VHFVPLCERLSIDHLKDPENQGGEKANNARLRRRFIACEGRTPAKIADVRWHIRDGELAWTT
jgi:hypothetical protein